MADDGSGQSYGDVSVYSGDQAANSFVRSQTANSYPGGGSAVYSGAPAAGVYNGDTSTGYGGHQSAPDASNASVVTGVGGGDASTGGASLHQNALGDASRAFNAGLGVGHAIGSGAAGDTSASGGSANVPAGMAGLPADAAAVNAVAAVMPPTPSILSQDAYERLTGKKDDWRGLLNNWASGGRVLPPGVQLAAIGAPVVPGIADTPPDLFPNAPAKIGSSPADAAGAASGGPSVPASPAAAVRPDPANPGGINTAFGAGSDTNPYPPDSAAYLTWNAQHSLGQLPQAIGDAYNALGEATKVGAGAAAQIVVDAAGRAWKLVTGSSPAEPPPIAPAVPVARARTPEYSGGQPSSNKAGDPWKHLETNPPPQRQAGSRGVKTETVTAQPLPEPVVPPATEQSVSIPHSASAGIKYAADAAALLPASSSVPREAVAASYPGAITGGTPTAPYDPYPGAAPSTGNTLASAQAGLPERRVLPQEVPYTQTSGSTTEEYGAGLTRPLNVDAAMRSREATGAAGSGAVAYPGPGGQMPQPLGPTAPQMYLRSGYTSPKMAASVKSAQNLLKSAGYDVNADGKYGKDTVAAVKKFQKDHAIQADGIVGPNTWAALTSAGSAKASGKQASNALGDAAKEQVAMNLNYPGATPNNPYGGQVDQYGLQNQADQTKYRLSTEPDPAVTGVPVQPSQSDERYMGKEEYGRRYGIEGEELDQSWQQMIDDQRPDRNMPSPGEDNEKSGNIPVSQGGDLGGAQLAGDYPADPYRGGLGPHDLPKEVTPGKNMYQTPDGLRWLTPKEAADKYGLHGIDGLTDPPGGWNQKYISRRNALGGAQVASRKSNQRRAAA